MPFGPRVGLWITLSLVLGTLPGCQDAASSDVSTRFLEAQATFNQARTADEFLIAAGLYQQILDGGFVSGAVLYNQGNALLRAGRRGQAIAAYRQAQRYRPRDPHLEANLNYARNSELAPESRRPTADTLRFWQGWLSEGDLLRLAVGAASAAWGLGLIRLGWRRRFLGSLALVCLATSGLVALALAYQVWRYEPGGVVIVSEAVVRKGNAYGFDPALIAPLREGTEFLLLERRDGWLRVRLAGEQEGWIEEHDATLF